MDIPLLRPWTILHLPVLPLSSCSSHLSFSASIISRYVPLQPPILHCNSQLKGTLVEVNGDILISLSAPNIIIISLVASLSASKLITCPQNRVQVISPHALFAPGRDSTGVKRVQLPDHSFCLPFSFLSGWTYVLRRYASCVLRRSGQYPCAKHPRSTLACLHLLP